MRLVYLLGGLALLAACNNGAAPESESGTEGAGDAPYERIEFAGQDASAEERAMCEAAGGEVQPAGRAGYDHCIQTFDDAGETCSDAADCTGRCLVVGEMVEGESEVTGECAADDSRFGCFQEIEGGMARPGICVD